MPDSMGGLGTTETHAAVFVLASPYKYSALVLPKLDNDYLHPHTLMSLASALSFSTPDCHSRPFTVSLPSPRAWLSGFGVSFGALDCVKLFLSVVLTLL
jgi:hypothetical protein